MTSKERDMRRGYYAALDRAKTEVGQYRSNGYSPEEVLRILQDGLPHRGSEALWTFLENYLIGYLCSEEAHAEPIYERDVEKDVDK